MRLLNIALLLFLGTWATAQEPAAVIEVGDSACYIDKKGDTVLRTSFDQARAFREGLAAVRKKFDFGFINKEGEVVIPPKYDEVEDFHDGMAAVKENNQWYFINRNGDKAFQLPENADHGIDFWHFVNGYLTVNTTPSQPGENKGKTWTYWNKDGEDALNLFHAHIDSVPTLKNKLSRFYDDDKIKFGGPNPGHAMKITRDSTVKAHLDPFEVTYLGPFTDGIAQVSLRSFNENIYRLLIDTTGEIQFMLHWKYVPQINLQYTEFSDGLLRVKSENEEGDLQKGYLDKNGNEVIPFKFKKAKPFHEGYAVVGKKSGWFNKVWGYINKKGEYLVEPKYNKAEHFSEGRAAVQVKTEEGDKKWGYINKQGDFAIQPRFRKAKPFNKGVAHVKLYDSRNEAIINKQGEVIWEEE